MTQQTQTTTPDKPEESSGQLRPDAKLSTRPGQNPPAASTGGKGAAGAGDPSGFGGAN